MRFLSELKHGGIAIGAVLCLAAGAGGGYFVGRSTTEKGTVTASCAKTKKAVRDLHQDFTQAGAGSAQAADIMRTQLNMVVQNPDCFSARVRAEAQTALDQAASAQH
ncbi:hypothetical protein ABZV67_44710 [Streptomyces sp. NPDC005065]|uniref:hypothetical protein n=1 Tax=unclassified Streptomyces TaxID=2593676 RepID=UPI0033A45F25